jgi:hypothetical protein
VGIILLGTDNFEDVFFLVLQNEVGGDLLDLCKKSLNYTFRTKM